MRARTDLAIEKEEYLKDISKKSDFPYTIHQGVKLSRIKTDYGSFSTFTAKHPTFFAEDIDLIVKEILSFLPQNFCEILVVGLGNRDITPDSIGPRCAEKIVATRHIKSTLKKISVLSPGVLGQTGIQTAEMIKSVAEKIMPDALLIIDALATSNQNRLCRTLQITDMGISPASGVGGCRPEISKSSMGIPVIAIGVPTVTDCKESDLFSMPKDIDILCETLSEILSTAINTALHKDTN